MQAAGIDWGRPGVVAKLSWAIHCQAQPAMIGWPAEWREGW
jgi:hypothetical protein